MNRELVEKKENIASNVFLLLQNCVLYIRNKTFFYSNLNKKNFFRNMVRLAFIVGIFILAIFAVTSNANGTGDFWPTDCSKVCFLSFKIGGWLRKP